MAYLVYETEENKQKSKELKVVVIDKNSRQITCSDGRVFKLPEVNLKIEAKIHRYQKKLARQIEGSNLWWDTKTKLQKLHRKLTAIRKNWRHRITKKLSGFYNTVILENLNTQEMTYSKKGRRFRKMNKNILETAWHDLELLLKYNSVIL